MAPPIISPVPVDADTDTFMPDTGASSSTSAGSAQKQVRWRKGSSPQRRYKGAAAPEMQSMPIGKSMATDDSDGEDLWDESVDAGLRPTDAAAAGKMPITDRLFLFCQFGCCCVMILAVLAGLLIPMFTEKMNPDLRDAVRRGDTESVSHILGDSSKTINVDAPGADEKTALHWAVIKGHSAVVAELLERRANVNLGSAAGTAALHFAAREGHNVLTQRLILAGADVNGTDANEWTPLHWSAMYGHHSVSESLINARVDTFAPAIDRHHKTALSLAQSNGHAPLAKKIDTAMQEAEKWQPKKAEKGSYGWR